MGQGYSEYGYNNKIREGKKDNMKISYINRWLLCSYGYIKQGKPQSYQHMHMPNVILKSTKSSSRDAIMVKSHKKGTMLLYISGIVIRLRNLKGLSSTVNATRFKISHFLRSTKSKYMNFKGKWHAT